MGILLLGRTYTYEGFVASRGWPNTENTASFNQIMSRSAMVASENLTSIKLCFQSFLMSVTDSGVGSAGSIKASIEYGGAVQAQLLFSGSSTGTFSDPGALFTDYASVSIPAGATFWVRIFYQNASGIIYNNFQGSGLSESCAVAVSGLTDQTGSTGAVTGGTSQTWSMAPLACIAVTSNPSALIIGDSRTYGSGDASDNLSKKVGNIARSMGSVPFCNISVPGETPGQFMNSANNNTRKQLLPYGSQVIVSQGINAIFPGGGAGNQTVAQTVAAIQSIWTAASAPRKYCITLEPYTSGSWTTNPAGNQTNSVPLINDFNDAVRAGIAGGTGYYELADVVMSARNSALWRVDAVYSSTAPYTDDGLHANDHGYTIIQNSGAVVPDTAIR